MISKIICMSVLVAQSGIFLLLGIFHDYISIKHRAGLSLFGTDLIDDDRAINYMRTLVVMSPEAMIVLGVLGLLAVGYIAVQWAVE